MIGEKKMKDFIKEEPLAFFIGLAILSLIAYLLIASILSEKITLIKKDWVCSDHRTELVMMQQVGNILVPINRDVCTQYNRK